MLPDIDLNTWRLPSHVEGSSPQIPTVQVALGWEWKPLWVSLDGQHYPIVDHLMHAQLGLARTFGPVYLQAQLPTSGVWNGEVGLAAPRALVGVHSKRFDWNVGASAPLDTLDSPLSEPYWTAFTSAGVRQPVLGPVSVFAVAGGTYRPANDFGHELHARAGLHVGAVSAAASVRQGTGFFSSPRAEGWIYARIPFGPGIIVQPLVGVGLTQSPGTPAVRAGLLITRTPLPVVKEVPKLVVEAPPPPAAAPPTTPPSGPVEPPPPPPPPPLAAPVEKAPPMEMWAVVEVHPPCGRADAKMWSESRLEPLKVVLEQQGIRREHVEVVVGDCSAKPNIRVKPEKRQAKTSAPPGAEKK